MRVDPAGDHVFAACVDHAVRLEIDRLRRREGDDAAVLDADVERLAGIGRDDGAALDHNVEHECLRLQFR